MKRIRNRQGHSSLCHKWNVHLLRKLHGLRSLNQLQFTLSMLKHDQHGKVNTHMRCCYARIFANRYKKSLDAHLLKRPGLRLALVRLMRCLPLFVPVLALSVFSFFTGNFLSLLILFTIHQLCRKRSALSKRLGVLSGIK